VLTIFKLNLKGSNKRFPSRKYLTIPVSIKDFTPLPAVGRIAPYRCFGTGSEIFLASLDACGRFGKKDYERQYLNFTN
jgi:hypothetical protein